MKGPLLAAAIIAMVAEADDSSGQEPPKPPPSEEFAIIEASRLLSFVDTYLSLAEADQSGPLRLERLRLLYFLSVDQEEYLELARAQVDQIDRGGSSPSTVTRAFLAALEVVRGRHAFWPHQKVNHVRTGLAALDRIVDEDPDQVEVRYLRLVSCFYLPFFFRRAETIAADMVALAELLPLGRGTLSLRAYLAVAEFVLGYPGIDGGAREGLQAAVLRAPELDRSLYSTLSVRSPGVTKKKP